MKRDTKILRFKTLVFICFMGISIISSFLSLFLSDIGLSNTQIGVLFSVMFFVGGLTTPLFLPIMGSSARMQKCLPYFTFLSSIIFLVCLLFTKTYYFALVIMLLYAVIKSTGYSMFESEVALFAVANDLEYSGLRSYGSLAYIVMPLAGGFIISWFGYSTLFSIGIACSILCLLLEKTLPTIPPRHTSDSRPTLSSHGGMKRLLKNPKYILFLFGQLFICAVLYSTEACSILYYNHRGMEVSLVGVFTAIMITFEFIALLVFSKKFRHMNGIVGQIAIGVIMIIRCICYAAYIPLEFLYLIAPLRGVQNALYITMTMSYIRAIVDYEDIGSAYLLNTLLAFMVAGFTNVFIGIVTDMFSYSLVYTIIGISVVIGIVGVAVGYKILYRKVTSFK